MTSLPKSLRLRLDPDPYQRLRLQVLERDGWRCQACGAMTHLEIHHLQFRSRQGRDTEENLISLCCDCHRGMHGG